MPTVAYAITHTHVVIPGYTPPPPPITYLQAFSVSIGSMYASSDNYYIVGPYTFGQSSPIVQLNSSMAAHINCDISETSYSYTLTSVPTGATQNRTVAWVQQPVETLMRISVTAQDTISMDNDLFLSMNINNTAPYDLHIEITRHANARLKNRLNLTSGGVSLFVGGNTVNKVKAVYVDIE